MSQDLYPMILSCDKRARVLLGVRLKKRIGVRLRRKDGGLDVDSTVEFIDRLFDAADAAGKADPPLPGESAEELFPETLGIAQQFFAAAMGRKTDPRSISADAVIEKIVPRWRRYRTFAAMTLITMRQRFYEGPSRLGCGFILGVSLFLGGWMALADYARRSDGAGACFVLLIVTGLASACGIFFDKHFNCHVPYETVGDFARELAASEAKRLRMRRFAARVYPVLADVLREVMERERKAKASSAKENADA